MKEKDMTTIAKFISKGIKASRNIERLRNEVIEFNNSFKNIHYSFDKELGLWEEHGNIVNYLTYSREFVQIQQKFA